MTLAVAKNCHARSNRIRPDDDVFCAPEVANSEAGPCFVEQSACEDVRTKAPNVYAPCEPRIAAACYNASRHEPKIV